MTLDFLDFDYSEDAQGHGSFDAMAAASPAQLPALQAEVVAVLAWAHRQFPDGRAALDDGGQWDYALHGVQETPCPLALAYEAGGTLTMRPGAPGPARVTLDLTLAGTPAFCAAFRQAFNMA